MYSDIESSVLNLGWKTKFFRLSRGLRQGCPLSALLFILVTEVLASNIRQDDSITGIILHENGDTKCEMRISQYADDTTLFCSTKESLDNMLNVINIFGKYAGPKLNVLAFIFGNLKYCIDKAQWLLSIKLFVFGFNISILFWFH